MARATVRERLFKPTDRGVFDTSMLFPEKPSHIPGPWVRGPFPKQRVAYYLVLSGACQGGGVVWQSGKGGMKTLSGCTLDFLVHHDPRYIGVTSCIGRESYPALATNTWTDYSEMLERIPEKFIKSLVKPSNNSAGILEWAIGGKTFFLSLSDLKTWASANFGFVWVDEGHLQDAGIVDALSDRLRQDRSPRAMFITSNAAGKKSFHHKKAHPKSPERLPKWFWLQSTMYDNLALPPDYILSMEAKNPPGTARHKRWVLGESAQIEGVAFEMFDPDVTNEMHVVPDFPIPPEWPRGRGLDWGVVNSYCCIVWFALAPDGTVFVYRTHLHRNRPASWHADRILEMEQGENIVWVPADPDVYKSVHEKESGVGFRSTADKFRDCGVRLTPADNNRSKGLEVMLDHLTVWPERIHPTTLEKGAPKLVILDNRSNEATIHCLETIEMRPEPSTGNSDAPDDVKKKDDDPYDALRYGLCAISAHHERSARPGKQPRASWFDKKRIHGRPDVGVESRRRNRYRRA